VPPLRERPEDVDPLIEHFVKEFCAANNFRAKAFAPGAMEALRRHRWRGNVRELKNAVERLLIMAEGNEIRAEDVAGVLRPATDDSASLNAANTLRDFKEAAERAFLVAKLRESDWNISATAQTIGTPRSNLYKKLDQYGITQETDG
jgi:two-component system nitrogen regulation response regulator NtrX